LPELPALGDNETSREIEWAVTNRSLGDIQGDFLIQPGPLQPTEPDAAINSNVARCDRSKRPACPLCGGPLIEIKQKLQCSQCRAICETCCEGGRG
jgi:hypothetical protein